MKCDACDEQLPLEQASRAHPVLVMSWPSACRAVHEKLRAAQARQA